MPGIASSLYLMGHAIDKTLLIRNVGSTVENSAYGGFRDKGGTEPLGILISDACQWKAHYKKRKGKRTFNLIKGLGIWKKLINKSTL